MLVEKASNDAASLVVTTVFGKPSRRFAQERAAAEAEAGEEDLAGDWEAPSVARFRNSRKRRIDRYLTYCIDVSE